MELLDAVRRMGRGYPGGLQAVALRLGKSYSTLDKEIRGAPGFKLGLQDAQDIMEMCHDVRAPGAGEMLALQAQSVGYVLIPMPETERSAMTLESLGRLMRETAELVSAVTQADADGQVCDNELKDCIARWGHLVAAGHRLMEDLKAQNAQTMARWEGGAR